MKKAMLFCHSKVCRGTIQNFVKVGVKVEKIGGHTCHEIEWECCVCQRRYFLPKTRRQDETD